MATRTLSRRSRRAEEPEDDYRDNGPDDDGEDEPPRRGRSRRSRDEDAGDEPPRRSRRSRSDDGDDGEDEPPRRSRSRRSRDDDEDEDRAPRSRRRGGGDDDDRSSRSKPNSTGKGWKAFKQKREERSDYVKNYKLRDQAALIKVLDEEPFSVYAEHWIDELKGKKSFVCIGEDCPLCDIGEKPRVYSLFNILDLDDPDDPKVLPWKVSQTVTDILEGYAEDKKTSPLNREDLYWSVHKTGGGKKGRVQVNVTPVKARDLEEDWDIVPFSDEELAEFEENLLTEDDVLYFNTRKELKEIADELD